MRRLLRLLLLSAAPLLPAADLALSRNGTILVDGKSRLQIVHYSDKWFPNRQSDANLDLPATGNSLRRGEWKLRGSNAVLQFETRVDRSRPEHWSASASLDSREGVPTGAAVLQFEIPAETAAGKQIRSEKQALPLPETFRTERIGAFENVTRLEVPLHTGIAELEFPQPVTATVHDARKFNSELIVLRIPLNPVQKQLKHAELAYSVGFRPYTTRPLDFSAAANMGLADEAAGDGRGGWTDQGPENDLRLLPPGELRSGPASFRILDPAANGGRSVIMLGGGGRPAFPRKAAVPAGNGKIRSLFLLHAVAWPPRGEQSVGTIRLRGRDGKETLREVVFRRDVENWWMPGAVPNGTVAWSAFRTQAPTGLYMSVFSFPETEAESVTFESNGKAVWGIVAASVSDQAIELPRQRKFTIWRGAEYRPFTAVRHIEPGSALDFSFLLDAPAGKYGFSQAAPDGTFRFEKRPEQPFRVYGVNLCLTANFLPREEADLLAERLARIGYNAVRLHHFDRDLVDRRAPDGTTFDPQQRDKLEYLIAAFKKRGIYLTLDLFTTRPLKNGELPGGVPDAANYKLLAMIDPAAKENLRRFARELLTHVNPYTGLALRDDPALLGISLINENTLIHVIGKAEPRVRAQYEAEFRKYLNGREPQNRDDEFRRFLHGFYAESYAELSAFMRGLGVKAPLTDQNYISAPELTLDRINYDYVDNHIYFDHPIFAVRDWSLPSKLNNVSSIAMRTQVPGAIAPTRIFGKPFTVTEFDYCHPNEFRAEGAPMFAACAALQGWAGIYRFAYAHHWKTVTEESAELNSFDVANDPVRLLGERLGIAFFLRGDVKTAPSAVAVAIPEDPAAVTDHFRYSPSVAERWIECRIGSVLQGANGSFRPALPEQCREVIPPDRQQEPPGKRQSETGELAVDFNEKSFLADTPYSAAMVLPAGTRREGKWFSAAARKGFAVAGAVKLDPARILILHLTDVKSEGVSFSGPDMRELVAEGKGPLLARRGVADLSVAPGPGKWELFALDLSGRRLQKMSFRREGERILFTADTFHADNVVFAYELRKAKD
ncbi:MAG: hypothetical protein HPZ91_18080 [Lentisphaeria bacterium]|nr:hypothetical protein [Lentisphaeria bacterium]